jgi:prevent-host-death family protein
LIDALTARTQFGAMLKNLEKQNVRFLISRRGKPKAVVLSVEDYLRNVLKKPSIMAEIQAKAKQAGLDRMSEEEISAEVEKAKAGLDA